MSDREIPIIDIFAGPGGLSEGFSSYSSQELKFKVKLSIEKDAVAHRTLLTRAFFRQFPRKRVPGEYYQYIRGEIDREQLFAKFPDQARNAQKEAWCAELGKVPQGDLHGRIKASLNGAKQWLLIGGPPCQAYSLVGRSRMLGGLREALPENIKKAAHEMALRDLGCPEHEGFSDLLAKKEAKLAEYLFHKDARHQLYKQYLEVVAVHQPTAFVMENVKGILSSKIKTRNIIEFILEDLKDPWAAMTAGETASLRAPKRKHTYKIYSLVVPKEVGKELAWQDYLIRAEDYGVPQKRHRVILLGVRDDVFTEPAQLARRGTVNIEDAIGDLPKLRSHISRGRDTAEQWRSTIREHAERTLLPEIADAKVKRELISSLDRLAAVETYGAAFIKGEIKNTGSLANWFRDSKIGGVLQHRARGHMASDLLRYLFTAVKAKFLGTSPTLQHFPEALLPAHKNTGELKGKKPGSKPKIVFEDRFRVQVEGSPATTITSHISKDGHYYIHYDPAQCRSLTPREAARVQTFPDNYFFEGNRTQQYHQVGNAVPPFLAFQIAGIVHKLFLAE